MFAALQFPRNLLAQAGSSADASMGAAEAAGTLGAGALPWLIAGAALAGWIGTTFLRRRSARALETALDSESVSDSAEREYPLLDRLASAAFRRVRNERERQRRLADRVGEIERVLRATPIAVIALDHLQRVVSANPAAERLLAFDERVARGRLLLETVRQPGLNRAIQSALSAEGRFTGELHLDSDDPLEVQVSCEPLHQDGAPSGLVVSLVDVTRMRRLESMRSEFAANVSHELRTPITNIKGYVETLLQIDDTEPVQTRRFLEIVHRNTIRLSGIVEDILTLAFLEEPEARHSLAKDAIPVREIVDQVVADLGSAATLRSMTLEARGDRDAAVVGNRSLLEQALANLVSNAIKYSSEGTAVRIEVSIERARTTKPAGGAADSPTESADLVRIAVADSGPGIASKHLPRIFERFYRVDKARARTQGGTGLGLAIVKHIASIHGGGVEAESIVGSGSRFSLLLPAAMRPTEARARLKIGGD
jgi:two-component system phosphate regulon sensor histidine kinase PhoR